MSSLRSPTGESISRSDNGLPAIEVHSFPAMGGTVEVQLVGQPAQEVRDIEALFADYEQVMSRFLPWSELSALNASAPEPFVASSRLFDVVREALDWTRATGGVFDPTVIDVLNGIGYDRTFELLRDAPRAPRAGAQQPRRWQSIGLDEETRTITLPEGVAIDLGGIGKGYTVDRAAEKLGPGATAIVNASGDLRAIGSGPNGAGWRIGVQDPFAPEEHFAVLVVSDRAVATSGSARRQWHVGQTRYHHLIDARSLTSSGSDLLTVTVIAESATEADVLAKVAFLLGSAQGLALLERFGVEAIGVRRDGHSAATTGIERYLAGVPDGQAA
jgi:FAD:protein FMN transferase